MWIEIHASDRALRVVHEPANEHGGPTLEHLQEICGGWIERIPLYEYVDGRCIDGWVDDEGLLKDSRQSVIIPGLYPDGTGVRGSLVLAAADLEGNSVALTKEEVEGFLLIRPNAPIMSVLIENDRGVLVKDHEVEGAEHWMPTLKFRPPRR